MAQRAFFPRRLHPVLDRGEGDKDAVLAPELPTSGAVGQAVFDHQADGPVLHAAGVLAVGLGQILHRGVETAPAMAALIGGVAHQQFAGALEIPQIVQAALARAAAAGGAQTVRAAAVAIAAAYPQEAGWGQHLDLLDPLTDLGYVHAGSFHGHAPLLPQ
jgi:hypothetical protein